MRSEPTTYQDLEARELRALAERTLANPSADPAHVEAAIARLSSSHGGLIGRLTPAEVRQLRALLRGVVEREDAARAGRTPGPDTRAT